MNPGRISRQETALCAHDLRGALAVISGYMDLLQRPDLTEADRLRAFSGIRNAIARAGTLLDTLSGVTTKAPAVRRVDLGAMVERAAADMRVITDRDIVTVIGSTREVAADPVALARVLQNVLENAATHAPSGPIEIRLDAEEGGAVLVVADHGPGIPPSDRKRVFEPRVRLGHSEQPGSGLGLVAVKQIVERLGGSVHVGDVAGGGTAVTIRLPAA